MSSAAQIDANRRNAQHCTGPQTEAGKAASKMNALRHGLASAQVVLPHEDRAAFEDLKAAFLAEHEPAGQTEQLLVVQLAEFWWRALRARRVESEYLNGVVAAAAPGDGDAALAGAVTAEKDNAFSKVQRYVNAADRAFKGALTQLRQIQQIRRNEEEMRRRREITMDLLLSRESKNGFVPQPSPQASQRTPPPLPPPAAKAPAGPLDGFCLKNPPPGAIDSILDALR